MGAIKNWGIIWHNPHGYVIVGERHTPTIIEGDYIRTSPIERLQRLGCGLHVETRNSFYSLIDPPNHQAAQAIYNLRHGAQPC